MSRQSVSTEQRNLKEATEQYIDSLPPMHRELLHLMAADYHKPPYAVVAGAIEEAIARWRADYLAKDASRKPSRVRLA